MFHEVLQDNQTKIKRNIPETSHKPCNRENICIIYELSVLYAQIKFIQMNLNFVVLECGHSPVCRRDFSTSGGIATNQLKTPAIPPANRVRPMLRSPRLQSNQV